MRPKAHSVYSGDLIAAERCNICKPTRSGVCSARRVLVAQFLLADVRIEIIVSTIAWGCHVEL
jgi:hypothetical protein